MIAEIERRGEEIAEERVARHALEVIGGEGRGGEAGDERRDGDADDRRRDEPQDAEARNDVVVGQARGAMIAPELPRGDERGDRAKGHLEAGLDDALRLERKHDEGGDGEVAHRDRRPVDQDRAKDDERHHVGADRRRAAAGEREVGGEHEERRERRPFADRPSQRERRRQSEEPAHDEEGRAGDQHHVQAGDREDVKEARDAEAVVGLRRERAPLADEERGGDGARLARLGRHDPLDDRRANARHREVEREGRRLRLQRPLAEHEAAAADPIEEGSAVRVVAAGNDGAGDRHQPSLERRRGCRAAGARIFRRASCGCASASPPAGSRRSGSRRARCADAAPRGFRGRSRGR